MKILHVNEAIGFVGGAEKNLYDTAVGLAGRGHESSILYLDRCEQGLGDFRRAFHAAFPLPRQAALAREAIKGVTLEIRPDLVYVHRFEPLELLAELVSSVPSVRMMHDVAAVCLRRHKYLPIGGRVCHRKVGPWCVFPCIGFVGRCEGNLFSIGWRGYRTHVMRMRMNRLFSRILVSSNYMRDAMLLNGFDSGRIVMFPPALPELPLQPEPVDERCRRVLFVGTQIRSKGVDLFLKMLTRLKEDFHATVIGSGRQAGRFVAMSESLNLAGRVDFVKWITHEQLSRYLIDSRVVAITSRAPESFNLVGLEAMGHRRPVVGFAVGGIPDWLADGENGFLVGEQDVDSMAARVDELLRDVELCRRLGDGGRSAVKKRFGFDAYLDKIEGLFREISGAR